MFRFWVRSVLVVNRVLRGVNQTYLYSSSLGLGHGMAMPLQSLEPGFVGAWLAVPQTQREELNL